MDVDWAGNVGNRRSTSGFAFSLGCSAIAWSNKKLLIVALSSTETEYPGAVVATCEAIWLKRLLKDLRMEASDSTTIFCDNLNIIQLEKNPFFYAWTKHIEVHYHFFHERVLSGEVELVYVPMDRQATDIFTKPLGLDKLRHFSGMLGVQCLDIPTLRGMNERKTERDGQNQLWDQAEKEDVQKAELDTDFYFGLTEQVGTFKSTEEAENEWTCADRMDKWRLVRCRGSDHKGKSEPKSTEKGGGESKKGKKVKTWTWFDVVKGLKTEDKLETNNSDKSKNDLVDMFDSEESDLLKDEWTRRQRKLTPTWRRV